MEFQGSKCSGHFFDDKLSEPAERLLQGSSGFFLSRSTSCFSASYLRSEHGRGGRTCLAGSGVKNARMLDCIHTSSPHATTSFSCDSATLIEMSLPGVQRERAYHTAEVRM